MTIVIVQCRLSSSRLPRKALLPLGGRPLVTWTLEAMHCVPADRYILAVDYDSEQELAPLAADCGWECFAGSRDDVLDRFCAAALYAECVTPGDIIVRATADNPFLFYEAARQLLGEIKRHPCDYITYTGLPHGSGVEIFNARSLIESCGMTSDPYDHEHVGPALYRHPENFASVMLPAPARWCHPDYRTTVDTYEDYRHALRIVKSVSAARPASRKNTAYTTEEICAAFKENSVQYPVLCVPSVIKGRGTGHLRRCLDISVRIGADIYIPESADLPGLEPLVTESQTHGLEPWQIIRELPRPGMYKLILADMFSMDKALAKELAAAAPLAAVDEGSSYTSYCDYLLDIIPAGKLNRLPNYNNPGFIPLPVNRKDVAVVRLDSNDIGEKVLVSTGGEDPAGLSLPAATAFADCGKMVTVVVSDPAAVRQNIPERLQKNIRIVPPVSNLREKLYLYDIVVTHYGFTAFEAVAAGCGVLLLGTTPLHISLASKYGFAVLPPDSITTVHIQQILKNPGQLYPGAILKNILSGSAETLADFVTRLSAGIRNPCPVCGNTGSDQVVARILERTFRRCSNCGILYMSWSLYSEPVSYAASYFFEDYQKQYGKTYQEDFPAIKIQCIRRMSVIDAMFWMRSGKVRKNTGVTPAVLDVGCAMGPFLDAASDAGWQVYGVDISPEAVSYVQNTLRYPAVCSDFLDFDPVTEFGVGQFDALTMWYVIEHFKDLNIVLTKVSCLLKKGGIFAFSTPSAGGVSARFSPEYFFASSPADHYTLWEPRRTADLLKRFGFKVIRQVSTGHHAERFPCYQNKQVKRESFGFKTLTGMSRCFKLGDTFEVYCIKVKDMEKPEKRNNNA